MTDAADTAKKEFTPGGEYWTAAAVKVELRGFTADGHYIVAPYYETEDYDGADTVVLGELRIEPKLYHEPPVELISEKAKAIIAEIEEKQKTLAAIQNVLTEETRKIRNAESQQRALIATLEKTEALQRCVDWIEGKFTHFVIKDGDGYRVEEAAEAMKSDHRVDTIGVKLLTLGGRSKNSLQWNLHEYSTGSGFAKHVWMFKSEDEAQAFRMAKIMADLQDAIDGKMDGYRDRNISTAGQVALAAKCEIPSEAMLEIRKAMLAQAKQDFEYLQKAANKAQSNADEKRSLMTSLEYMIEKGDAPPPAPLAPMPGPDDSEIDF